MDERARRNTARTKSKAVEKNSMNKKWHTERTIENDEKNDDDGQKQKN